MDASLVNKKVPIEKNFLDRSPFLSGLIVPVGVILIGSLLVFGIYKLLNAERNHRDLVRELNSKTFGNRWVAAFELSKVLASSQISEDEVPWLVENLGQILQSTADNRTKNFIVVALGRLNDPRAIPLLEHSLDSNDDQIRFSALVALGNLPIGSQLDWQKISKLLDSDDAGLVQVVIYTLAHHRIDLYEKRLVEFLDDERQMIRYAAAIGLINYQNILAKDTLTEILWLRADEGALAQNLSMAKVEQLKMNVLDGLKREEWNILAPVLSEFVEREQSKVLATKGQELINLTKAQKAQ